MPTIHDSYKSTEPVDYDAGTKQDSANRLAQAAPALLRGCEQAADLLGRLNTPDAPTWAEVATTLGRLLAVVATARGTAAVEAVEESWPDTSPGFTFWQAMGNPDDWQTWPVSGIEQP